MPLGSRTRRTPQIDGRRCCKCKKVACDIIDEKYLCRLHSPMREGFATAIAKEKAKAKEEKKSRLTKRK